MNNSLFTNSFVGNHFKNVQTTIFSTIFFKVQIQLVTKGANVDNNPKAWETNNFRHIFNNFNSLLCILFVHKKCGSTKLHQLGQESTNILHFEISCKSNFKNEKKSTISNTLWQFFCIF